MARQEFPKMVYHKVSGAFKVVEDERELDEVLRSGYQRHPVPALVEVPLEDRLAKREAELDAREKALDEREAALKEGNKKQFGRSA